MEFSAVAIVIDGKNLDNLSVSSILPHVRVHHLTELGMQTFFDCERTKTELQRSGNAPLVRHHSGHTPSSQHVEKAAHATILGELLIAFHTCAHIPAFYVFFTLRICHFSTFRRQ
jgi:hypothetical protein